MEDDGVSGGREVWGLLEEKKTLRGSRLSRAHVKNENYEGDDNKNSGGVDGPERPLLTAACSQCAAGCTSMHHGRPATNGLSAIYLPPIGQAEPPSVRPDGSGPSDRGSGESLSPGHDGNNVHGMEGWRDGEMERWRDGGMAGRREGGMEG